MTKSSRFERSGPALPSQKEGGLRARERISRSPFDWQAWRRLERLGVRANIECIVLRAPAPRRGAHRVLKASSPGLQGDGFMNFTATPIGGGLIVG